MVVLQCVITWNIIIINLLSQSWYMASIISCEKHNNKLATEFDTANWNLSILNSPLFQSKPISLALP